MKKSAILIAGMLLVAASAAIAQKMNEHEGMGTGMMMGNDSGMSMDHRAMMMGPGMAMGWMIMPKVVATQADGGIIVLTGTKLIKYDKDLMLKKEVMVPIDTASAAMMMHHMKAHMMSGEKQ